MAILKRLTQLLLNNNRITRISEGLGKALPKLETLVLTNNRLSTLAELEPLAHLPTITSLALVDNPVSKLKDYRAFVIALLPRLKVLDYKRVKLAEREEAEGTFRRSRRAKRGDGVSDEVLAAEQTGGAPRAAPTEEQIAQIRQAILTASSLEEVQKLESALARGDYSVLSKMAPAEAEKGAAEG